MSSLYYKVFGVLLVIIVYFLFALSNVAPKSELAKSSENNAVSIFDFSVENYDGVLVSLNKYRGHTKAFVVVNVASKWGLTKRNYAELNSLYAKYKESGLEILAFPCNNFKNQEPGDNYEIQNFAKDIMKAQFPIFGKLECENGDLTHPLFRYLKSADCEGEDKGKIKWNFSKFLIDEHGIPIKRYGPKDAPLSFTEDIERLLVVGF